jgi:hemoglobin-like flavoprotein
LAMSKRHRCYGVKSIHYQLVGNALIWTLQQALGTEWNNNVEDSWKVCYSHLANIMDANG